MWNGHRMLRHRGHRDELTADLLSKRRDNYPGNFICLPRFLPSSKYFQSLLDDRLSSFFCFLFVSSSSFSFLLLARRQYSASHSPSFKFSYWFLPLFFSSSSFFSLPLLFVARRLFFDDYTWPKGKRIVRLTTTFFDTRVFCGE